MQFSECWAFTKRKKIIPGKAGAPRKPIAYWKRRNPSVVPGCSGKHTVSWSGAPGYTRTQHVQGGALSVGLPPLGPVATPLETRAAGASWVTHRDAVSCEPCWPGGGFVISWVVRVFIFPSFSGIFFWKWVFGVLATVHPIKQRAKYYA